MFDIWRFDLGQGRQGLSSPEDQGRGSQYSGFLSTRGKADALAGASPWMGDDAHGWGRLR